MKKYLMTGVAALTFAATFTSCSNHDIEQLSQEDIKKADFKETFYSTFGKPAKDQNWGFVSQAPVDLREKATTRGHNVNRNQWEGQFFLPGNVTSAEETAVLNELAKGSGNRDKNLTINLADFFVYHVHKGTDSYNDHNNSSIGVASDKMNELKCGSGTVGTDGVQIGFWEHVNDFNSGTQNANWWNIEGATLMLNSSSLNFAYHSTADSKYHDTYTVIDGATIGYPGFYYICFDFLANGDIEQPANKNMGVDRNYNYTDWIVRVSPAKFKSAKMIIAEDLAADQKSDFDYNDVVFEAAVANEWVASENANKLVAHITLRAAGGTMPLYIGQKDPAYEVHNLFGVDTKVMVNTAAGKHNQYAVVNFAVILGPENNSEYNIKDIPVYVTTKNGDITLAVETGEAPEKICVDLGFDWCDERQPIQTKYMLFPDWVQDKSVRWYNTSNT